MSGYPFPGLAGRTAVVVGGAGGGVGSATVAMLVDSGADVLVVDRAAPRADVTALTAEITTDEGIEALGKAVADREVGALVNVVGGVTPDEIGHFLELDPGRWRQSLELNFLYAVRTCQVVARRMAESGGGALVNLSVADATRAMPWFSAYAAARSGLESATRTMAVELGPLGIRANSVAWGLIASPRAHAGREGDRTAERRLIPLGRRGGAAEVASVVLFLLSDLGSYVTGQNLVVDGGLSLRSAHYGPGDNVPEFLESEPARRRLRETFERLVRRDC